ncbi:LysR family transcriptional regulator [Ferrimonas balearica]|uniref:LysR family transcriptional regulator n=1 Tax=Ferrimonas balearica TaxID=44012 RepID=UPI001C992CF5|nr:LysR family transcriptional regulator [Ferrimonas balearica]MBY5921615.1 LysR family transcriptional regulator [Ferrimonas balearica]MBY5995045.1 LysR family transcriptional regulator [Ferrimonas balearica]
MKMALDLNLMGYLVVLSRYPRLSAALQQLGVSRATLNRGLAQLRDHYGDDLYLLVNGQFEPTPFARELVQQLGPAYQTLQTAFSQTKTFDFSALKGGLKLYAPATLAEVFTPELIGCLKAANSELMLESIAWMGQGAAPLQAGEMAFCVDLFPLELNRDLVQRRVGSIPIGLYLHPDHPLLNRQAIEVSDLAAIPLVRQWAGEVSKYGDRARQSRMLMPNVALSVTTVLAALRCAERYGYGLVAARVYDAEVGDRLCWRPIVNQGEPVELEYGFYFHRSWYQHPFIQEIEGMLKQCHRQLLGDVAEANRH